MRLKKICRIESYPNRTVYGNGEDPIDCDWNEVYILDLRYGKKDGLMKTVIKLKIH